VLVENKVTPSAAMQMVRCIYMVFPLPPFWTSWSCMPLLGV
jgi:hypothetical protein